MKDVAAKAKRLGLKHNFVPSTKWLSTRGGGGGGRDAVARIGKKCGENAGKNAIENAVLLEWYLPLETPMFRLVLHKRALKAWTV